MDIDIARTSRYYNTNILAKKDVASGLRWSKFASRAPLGSIELRFTQIDFGNRGNY